MGDNMKKSNYIIISLLAFFPLLVNAETDSYETGNFFGSLIDNASKTLNIDYYSVITIFVIIVILIAIVLAYIIIKKTLYDSSKNQKFLEDVSNRKNGIVDPKLNPEEFKKFVANIFKITADAFSNYKYEVLKESFSEKLYNEKKYELDSHKSRKLRNVISHITPLYCQINNIRVIDDIEYVDVLFTAQFKDYIVADTDADVIVSGSKRDTQERTYLLTFSKKESNLVCPKCGGEVQNDKCLYCRYSHSEKKEKWFMEKMKILKQKTLGR